MKNEVHTEPVTERLQGVSACSGGRKVEEVRPYRPGKSVSRAPPGFSLEAATAPPYLSGIYIKTDQLQNSLKCSGLHDAASAVCMSFSNQVTSSLWGDLASGCQFRHPRTRHTVQSQSMLI